MNPFDHQRRHPILTVTLFVVMLAPGPFLVVIVGRLLKAAIPHPNAVATAAGTAGSLVFLFPLLCGMIAGGTACLLVAPCFAKRKVLEPFFVYPGVPLFSTLAAKIFAWAYRSPAGRQQ